MLDLNNSFFFNNFFNLNYYTVSLMVLFINEMNQIKFETNYTEFESSLS